jgi:hypothetical protein
MLFLRLLERDQLICLDDDVLRFAADEAARIEIALTCLGNVCGDQQLLDDKDEGAMLSIEPDLHLRVVL